MKKCEGEGGDGKQMEIGKVFFVPNSRKKFTRKKSERKTLKRPLCRALFVNR